MLFRSLPNINDLYRQMMKAVLDGGHGHEFTWMRGSEGVDIPVAFYPMHKSRFVFDRMGNMAILTRDTPVWGSYVGAAPARMTGNLSGDLAWMTPPGRFAYHKYMAEGGPWFRPASEGFVYWGRGENTHLYVPVTFDQFVVRFRMKWLEKHGMPFTCLYYTPGMSTPEQVRQIAESIRGEAIALIPRGSGPTGKEQFYSLDFIQPPTIGHDAFASFSDTWTKPAVNKILLGGVESMEIGDAGGYNATIDQRDAGENVIFRYDAMNIDTTMNQQLIPYIVRAVPRWKDVPQAHLPRHCLTPERGRNRMEELELLQATAMMVPVRESDVYDVSGIQRPNDGANGGEPDRTVFLGQPQQDQFGGLMGPGDAGLDQDGDTGADGESGKSSRDKKGKKKVGTPGAQARAASRFDPRSSIAQATGKLAGRRKDK